MHSRLQDEAEPNPGGATGPDEPERDAASDARLEQAIDANQHSLWRRFAFPSLRTRLVAIIFLALLPAFLLLIAVSALERNRAEANAAEDAIATARILRNEYTEIIRGAEQLLSLAAEYPEITSNDPAACTARLQTIFATTRNARGMSVADPNGLANCVAAPQPVTTTLEVGGRSYFNRAIEAGGFAVGGLDTGSVSRRPNLTFGYAVTDAGGALQRVIGYGLDVGSLNERQSSARFAEDAVLLVVDARGTTILRVPDGEEYVGRRFNIDQLELTDTVTEGVQTATGLDGEDRLYGFSTVEYAGEPVFHVLVGYANERIFGGVERTLRASLIGLSIISLVALAAAWLGAESMIVNRISRIVAVADRMREGDLAVRTGMTDDTSEFGQLAVTLDSLAAALQERRSDNERLLGQMRLLNSELEERVVERTRQLVKSNERLLASQAELRRLSHQLMRATEQERTRISREIHDQLGQMLTAIKIELRSARRRLADKEGSALAAEALAPDALAVAVTKLDDTSRMLDEMVVLVRRIAADLRPGLLDDFGLAAAVDWQLQEFRKVSGVEYTLDADLDESRLTPNQATAAFRILQESLTNVARHAHATAVDVQLSMDDHGLMLQVQDNGRGLPTDGSSRPRSLGLLGMRERAVELGGAVEISSASGQGTAVNLWLPLDAGATDSDWSADTPVHGADVDLADDGASAGPPALMAPSAPSPL